MAAKDLKVVAFRSQAAFHAWLRKSFDSCPGIWMRIFKKGSGEETITYDEALEEALCFGWIDGQKKSFDERSWLQKFTPRRSRSIWSKRNTLIVQRLIQEGRMKPTGLKAVDEAKADGRWDNAYSSPREMKIPEEFLEQLKKSKKAYEFFKTLNRSQLYSIAFRLQTAKKEETRLRRLNAILEMLKKERVS